ncbi:MAG: thioredoxin domain-containing protein [Clostridia bacterium]
MKITDKSQNRLIHEKSPYLLQHAYNPIDWYPWDNEAFAKAKAEDKPIFLSIGYSTCHWCHVMERESFEDEEVAELLNKEFVSIKVDREERPDIDTIYMTVCQALTGRGGWPLTILMTPDKKSFYAGTYFPKNGRFGIPGLIDILKRIAYLWKTNRQDLQSSGNEIINAIKKSMEGGGGWEEISIETIDRTYEALKQSYDPKYGGFGRAPKFPTPHHLLYLLRYWRQFKNDRALEMVEHTLQSMYQGGIYDHIGFGFSRYSTDRKWLIPHFEKMLYDNAFLAMAYLEAFQATKKREFRLIAEQIFNYILRDMTSPEGGFFSAEDADSEGVEGKFYVWTPDEIKKILGQEEGKDICKLFRVTEQGNFEGKNILNLIDADKEELDRAFEMESSRSKLYEAREKRVHPHKDDKILTSWNGLMIAALSKGARILQKYQYKHAAEKAAGFILDRMVNQEGRLLARYRDGEAGIKGYVDDYTFLIWGLLELYEASYDSSFLEKAYALNKDLLDLFWDYDSAGLFLYGKDGEEMIVRPKESYDGALPSGNSVSAFNFIRLARLTGDTELEELAQRQFEYFGSEINQSPISHTFFMMAFLCASQPTYEIVVVGDREKEDTQKLLSILSQVYLPMAITLLYAGDDPILEKLAPFVKNQKKQDGRATAYICRNYACEKPITDPKEFEEMLKKNIY